MPDSPEKWKIDNMADLERIIDILHRRSIRDKNEIDLLCAQVDLLRTPWWNPRARRRCKRWIAVLSQEKEEDRAYGID